MYSGKYGTKYVYFHCTCDSNTHTIRAILFDDKDPNKEVFISFEPIPPKSIYKRLENAVRYVMGKKTLGPHDDVIIDKTNIPQLKEIIDYLEKQ